MQIPQTYFLATPPSIDGPWVHAFSIFGLMGAALLASEWLWRTSWAMIERPSPICHPITVARAVWALMLSSLLIYMMPDVLLTVMWTDLEPAHRFLLSRSNRILDGIAILPLFAAWTLGVFSSSVIDHQLERRPIPVDLWPTWKRLRRGFGIGLILLAMSVVIAFYR